MKKKRIGKKTSQKESQQPDSLEENSHPMHLISVGELMVEFARENGEEELRSFLAKQKK